MTRNKNLYILYHCSCFAIFLFRVIIFSILIVLGLTSVSIYSVAKVPDTARQPAGRAARDFSFWFYYSIATLRTMNFSDFTFFFF